MDSHNERSAQDVVISLAQLGQAIKDNADRIQEYFKENGVQDPSFKLGAPLRLDLPPTLEAARQGLFDDIEHLTALLRGPLGHVLTNSNPVTFSYTIVLSAISRFGIAQQVPSDGSPITLKDLAAACHLEESDLIPLMRAAIANRTFEAIGDSVKHNAASSAIASMPDLRHWLAYSHQDFTPAAFYLPEAIAKWPGAVAPEQAAFALLTPERLPMFTAINSDPARAERFAGSMRLLGRASAAEIPRVVEDLQLDGLDEGALIVDVGGSTGEVLTHVLRRYRQLDGVVQDLPQVIAKAEVPEDLQGRLIFEAVDFFDPQPQKDASIFLLRKVCHDWSDQYASKILHQLIPALRHGTRIIINELCPPTNHTVHPRREQNQRGWDLAMKWLLNGKEREEGEWIQLFRSVDSRYQFLGARPVAGATSSLIEFTWHEPLEAAGNPIT